jgi:tetratricopeptide (TPR) repeat protein
LLITKVRVACLVYRAAALQGRGELEKVIDTAERILLLDPASLPALFLLAENCIHVRSYARAEQVLEEALRLHPETAHFHALLAQVRERMGKPAETFLPHLRAYRDARRETRSRGRRGGDSSVATEIRKARESLDAWAEELLRREEKHD